MRKMKLYELVNQYHIGTNLSCAEAMFKACNEYYHLHLSEETRRMFSVMGIGMQTEQSCCCLLYTSYHGYSVREIAALFDISHVAASKLDQRAKKKLKELCEKEGIL